ncbi:MarR family winged helix-turn-helix transcriptional regulator [Gordonia aurantiaca]|uniref:MarR family winged helix-turn-helix transcriptional regulator n=1 Tax=Gordonia sp. B21 TaxID=3151852 RepID=UPI0032671F99
MEQADESRDRPEGEWTRLPSWMLTRAAEHAHRIVSDRFGSVGARGYHYRVLAALDRFGPASQAELSRRSGIHVSEMVGTINDLTAAGHVERSPDPSDRRRNVISLTASGRRRLVELRTCVERSQEELLQPLTRAERAQLIELLTRLSDHHGP